MVSASTLGHQVDQLGSLWIPPRWLFTVAAAGSAARPAGEGKIHDDDVLMSGDLCLAFGQENVDHSGPFRKSRETGIRVMSQPGVRSETVAGLVSAYFVIEE
jgi:hypothetical protein